MPATIAIAQATMKTAVSEPVGDRQYMPQASLAMRIHSPHSCHAAPAGIARTRTIDHTLRVRSPTANAKVAPGSAGAYAL